MAFGINLRKLRRKHKLSQKELADLLGFGTSTIAQYENNKREPNFERLRKIKEFFEVSYNYLLEDDKKIYKIKKIDLRKILYSKTIYFDEKEISEKAIEGLIKFLENY